MVIAGRHGPRLCPARRGISRSASGSQAGLSISDAVIPAKLLRLVCDTAAVRARVQQRSASGSQAGLSISDAVIPAKLLRLVCDTAAVRAPRACGRKPDSSGRCALPAQSMTRTGMTGVSSSRRALEPLKKLVFYIVNAKYVTKTHNYAKIAGREPSFFHYQPPPWVPASVIPAAPPPQFRSPKSAKTPAKPHIVKPRQP
jgi:hypothetical protein